MRDSGFSLIIPARNAAGTLNACLASIAASDRLPDEVLVVDDGSADASAEIALKYECTIIRVDIGQGPMQARFAGARQAKFPVLVFVDADVCLPKDACGRLLEHFTDDSIHAAGGILSRESGMRGFFSIYKNEYMNYVFKRKPRDSRFLYGSFWAVRRDSFIYFDPLSDPFGSVVSDSEMGFLLSRSGRKIVLDTSLEVQHFKEYSAASLIRNDFVIPFMFSGLFVKYARGIPWMREKRFSHASLAQTAATAMSFMSFIAIIGAILLKNEPFFYYGAFFSALFFIYWMPFFLKVRLRGGGFLLKSIATTWLDAAVMFTGMVCGFAYALGRLFLRTKLSAAESCSGK